MVIPYAVTDGASGAAVARVDATTATPTLLSDRGFLQYPRSIDLAPDPSLIVSEGGPSGAVVRVDPSTGAQTVALLETLLEVASVGADGGRLRHRPRLPAARSHLYRLDLATGATVPIPNATIRDSRAMATDALGMLIVSDYYDLTVRRMIDPVTGFATVVSPPGRFMAPWGVASEPGGKIVVADNQGLYTCNPPPPGSSTCRGALYRIDLATGEMALLTEQGKFQDITGVNIYRGPSTSTPARETSWGRLNSTYR